MARITLRLRVGRARYVDVLDYILFLNANADVLYSLVWGDKDLYELAFALAGSLGNFTQVHGCLLACLPWICRQLCITHAHIVCVLNSITGFCGSRADAMIV